MSGVFSQLPGIVSAALTSALGEGVEAATLTKRASGASDGRGGRTVTESAHVCRGLVTAYSDSVRLASRGAIATRDRKAIILGASLPAGIIPAEGDKLTIGGAAWTVIAVSRDPSATVYSLQLRPSP